MATEANTQDDGHSPDAHWQVLIHRAAERELGSVTGDAGDELTHRLKQLKYYEEPTKAPYVKQLSDHDGLWRVRVDGFRAICQHRRPAIEVLGVGSRSRIYEKLDLITDRADPAGD
jgi:mRNA-degrading endonuclease RelE of RelBE toxin-antitoxin system